MFSKKCVQTCTEPEHFLRNMLQVVRTKVEDGCGNICGKHISLQKLVFASRLARNALPTNSNKKERNILTDDTCKVCGVQSESAYHAVVVSHSRALHETMRADWPVSDDSQLQFTGPDWFLLLLDRLSEGERSAIILFFFFWRNWSDRNSDTWRRSSFY